MEKVLEANQINFADTRNGDSKTNIVEEILQRKSITFADVKHREVLLQTEAAKVLFSALPVDIVEKLKASYLEGDITSPRAMEVIEYFYENSVISKMVQLNPSNSITFEYLYLKKKIINPIDKYFTAGTAAIGIYERLQALKKELPNIIRQEIKKSGNGVFKIANIGSGPSHELVEIMTDNPDLVGKVHITCIDPDALALEIGKKRVKKLGIENSFTFVPKPMQEYKNGTYNMLLAIGLLCPVSNRGCKKILSGFSFFSKFNGIVVFSTVQEEMINGDPLTDFIMRRGGWKMSYKRTGEPEVLAKASGWEPEYQFRDKLGYNQMTAARLKWNWKLCLKKLVYNVYKMF